jgi:hypothetical protein
MQEGGHNNFHQQQYFEGDLNRGMMQQAKKQQKEERKEKWVKKGAPQKQSMER